MYSTAPKAVSTSARSTVVTVSAWTRYGWLAVALCFVIQILSNIGSIFYNGAKGQAALSRDNPTYATPDGITFSIWGIIYTFELIATVYQAWGSNRNTPQLVKSRHWICAAFLANAAWLPIFQYELWWLSLVIICGYLYSLHRVYETLGVEYVHNPKVSWQMKVAVFTGFSCNFSWVCVATLLTVGVVLLNSDIVTTVVGVGDGKTVAIGGNVDWAIMCVVLACLISLYRACRYADIPYSFVTCWALAGVYRMQTIADAKRFPVQALSSTLATWALIMAVISGCGILVALVRMCCCSASSRRYSSSEHDSRATPLTA